ncbi:MAG TPA: zinc ribbon domain-containing protein [Labilithrix sp.]|nr:zinc ribbon domain-containing protein [Labilithrix sp.]
MSTSESQVQLDERRLGRNVAIGLPILTITLALIVGVIVGPATSVLVLAAGLLLGVIALLWSSLRILSGDVALAPEIEALDMAAQGVDALSSRKKMLLRALKDLESEHAIGKMEDEDYEQISLTYRAELKTVLKRIDETLAPHRSKAEEVARAHLRKVGLTDIEPSTENSEVETPVAGESEPSRVPCPKCGESNEADAKFCKECATKLTVAATKPAASAKDDTKDSDAE